MQYMIYKVKAIYSILVGISIISLWCMLFITSQVPELDNQFIAISLHIFSELLLAITLIIAGIELLRKTKRGDKIFIFSMGLLIYSVINAAGYYGQSANWGMVVMFSILGVISTVLVIISLRKQ